jgi:hypothetical protein
MSRLSLNLGGWVTSGCWCIVGSACDTVVEVLGAGLVGGCFFEGGQQLGELPVALRLSRPLLK